jgi:DNA-binding response OmpR family regulator
MDAPPDLAPSPPVATAAAARCIEVLCDDPAAAVAWQRSLVAEGLDVRLRALAGALGAEGGLAAADARVLYFARAATERLGLVRIWRAADPVRPLVTVCHALRDLDHVLALELGADDVLDAGLAPPVAAARLRALWRREQARQPAAEPEQLRFGALSVSLPQRAVRIGEQRVDLTEAEFEVLWLLATRAGRPVPRAELLKRTRGLDYDRRDRSIDCRVYRIRHKLGDTRGDQQRIRTVRNCGYLLSPTGW